MQSLPDDVLREIFELCGADDIIPSILTPDIAPVLLTHVSRRWTTIAHSTPRLWSSISITFRKGGKGFSQDHLQNVQDLDKRALEDTSAMRRWINFSAMRPLSVQFVSSNNFAFEGVRQFFQFLIETSPRWQRLYFSPTRGQLEGMPLEFTQALLSINLPLLETLEFGDFARFIRPNSVLLRGQQLRDISYLCSPRDWSFECSNQLSHLNIRWPYLTSLQLSCGTSRHPLNDYLTVLRRCSSLIHCSIMEEHYHPRNSPADDLAPVLLLYLQTLSLCLSSSALKTCFSVLNTPALKDLSFRWNTSHSHPPDSSSSSLFSFLSMSRLAGNNKIRRLSIDPIHFTKPTFYRLLESFPALEALSCRTDFDRETQNFTQFLDTTAQQSPSSDSYLDDIFLHMLSGTNSSPTFQSTTRTLVQRRAGGSMRLPAFVPGGSMPALLPQLTKLTCLSRMRFSEEVLLSFVQARRPLLIAPIPASAIIHPPPTTGRGAATAVLRYIAFAESQNGHLAESDLLLARSVKQRLQPFEDDGLVVDIHKYYDVDGQSGSAILSS